MLRLGIVQNLFQNHTLLLDHSGNSLLSPPPPFVLFWLLTHCFNNLIIPSDLNISKCNSKPWHWCQEIVHIPSTCKIWDLVDERSVYELDWMDWWTRMRFRWGAIIFGQPVYRALIDIGQWMFCIVSLSLIKKH